MILGRVPNCAERQALAPDPELAGIQGRSWPVEASFPGGALDWGSCSSDFGVRAVCGRLGELGLVMRIARFTDGISTRFGRMTDDLLRLEVLAADPLFEEADPTGEVVKLADVRLLAPVANPSKIVAIGKNYADHIKEFDSATPEEPIIFLKPTTSLIGPGDSIVLPTWTEHVDHEVELAVVIKSRAKDVPVEEVDEVIHGYTVANDISARDIQKRDGQWARAKGFDTACPLGPWIVVDPELDIENLRVTAAVNGQIKQSESTAQMINSVRELISFVSRAFTLLPGDVVLTGTPAGVSRIDDGDVVAVSVEGIGTLSNPVTRVAR